MFGGNLYMQGCKLHLYLPLPKKLCLSDVWQLLHTPELVVYSDHTYKTQKTFEMPPSNIREADSERSSESHTQSKLSLCSN